MANPKGKLSEYAAKRAFEATPEPEAVVAEGSGPLLFVVQQHAARRMHWDFRLECDGVLKSWAVPKAPSLDRADKRLAVETEDHPYAYASFEGVIPPKQYGAGEVIVWDCGVYSPDEPDTCFHDRAEAERRVREGLAKGKLSFLLRGEKLKGSFALVRTKEARTWLLIKHRDRFVSSADVTAQNRSVLSGIAVEDLKVVPVQRMPAALLAPHGEATKMPAKIAPMQAEIAAAPFNRNGWMWEPKLDGYRVIAFVDRRGVRLQSRRGIELADAFPALVAELAEQQVDSIVLDGEIVAFDDGKPSFNALQNRVQLKGAREIAAAEPRFPVVLFCFDLLYFAGIDLRRMRYRERRRYLAQCLLPTQRVQLVHASADGVALHAAAIASGFEGVVGKRMDSCYESGRRTPDWLKVKPTRSADFVIGGYTSGKGSRSDLGALLLGYWDDKRRLHYASHVGSGFSERSLQKVKTRLDALKTRASPFAEKPAVNGAVTWVRPELVAEVKFHEWTGDDALRAPVFLRLREDIDPATVRRVETAPVEDAVANDDDVIAQVVAQLDAAPKATYMLAVGAQQIKLTNLDRVYWPADPALQQPALTKRDLMRYLAQVSPYMLPHLADRPLTMIRMPDGITRQRFFQKHWEQTRPAFVDTIEVFSASKDESGEYLVCNNLPTLLWLAQSGTLEFHIWHSRSRGGADTTAQTEDYSSSLEALESSVLNFPDYVVFDIDPYIYSGKEGKGEEPELNTIAFEKGKEVAFWLRDVLASMSLEAIVKTSGKTGLHVFVPIRRTIDFDAARAVSELVGRHLMRLHPQDITMEWSVPKRTGKIFMDYNMNVRGKTLNVAYSPRGVAGAPISMPLSWDELAKAHPLDFRMTNVINKLTRSGDRWRNALKDKQNLEAALKHPPDGAPGSGGKKSKVKRQG
jgi:bifunctional non-homologous end joining protein LigD